MALRRSLLVSTLLPAMLLAVARNSHAAEIRTYRDKTAFLADTSATAATGPLPDLGLIPSAIVGSVTFSLAPGGDNLAIGATGTLASPDWCPLTPGNDIAMGFENLAVALAGPVYSLGFDFVQPNVSMPSWGGTPVDSIYEISLSFGASLVGKVQFESIASDVETFLGVWTSVPFDSATIIDITPSPFVDDDEFLGEFHTGTNPAPALTACTDKATFPATHGATSATGPLPDIGLVSAVKLGSVTLSIAPGGDNMAIGGFGIASVPDWSPLIPGNDIAMGYENLQIDLDEPVLALGFDFAQPDVTMPAWGGTPVDSTFEIRLFLGAAFVGSLSFDSIPTDQLTFVGVCSDAPFDRATIIDVTASPFVDDDEFFGEIYTAPGPSTWTNLGHYLDGVWGDPVLSGSGPLTAGSPGALVLTNAAPASVAILIASLSANPQNALCGTIVPLPALQILTLPTNLGEISLAWSSWSAGLEGSSLHFQYLIADPAAPCGVAMSNALRGDVP